jgi:hypothetical protein
MRDNEDAGTNRITYIAVQLTVNTIAKTVLSMYFAYIQYWARDVFSMDPPRDYISSPVANQKLILCGGGVEYRSSSE